jgi:hypothetical protein
MTLRTLLVAKQFKRRVSSYWPSPKPAVLYKITLLNPEDVIVPEELQQLLQPVTCYMLAEDKLDAQMLAIQLWGIYNPEESHPRFECEELTDHLWAGDGIRFMPALERNITNAIRHRGQTAP